MMNFIAGRSTPPTSASLAKQQRIDDAKSPYGRAEATPGPPTAPHSDGPLSLAGTKFKMPMTSRMWGNFPDYARILAHFTSDAHHVVTSQSLLLVFAESPPSTTAVDFSRPDLSIFMRHVDAQLARWYSASSKAVLGDQVPCPNLDPLEYRAFTNHLAVVVQALEVFKTQFRALVEQSPSAAQGSAAPPRSSLNSRSAFVNYRRMQITGSWASVAKGAIVIADVKTFKLGGRDVKRYGTGALVRDTSRDDGEWVFSVCSLEESLAIDNRNALCEAKLREIDDALDADAAGAFVLMSNNEAAILALKSKHQPSRSKAVRISSKEAFMEGAKKALSKEIGQVHRAWKKQRSPREKAQERAAGKKRKADVKLVAQRDAKRNRVGFR